MKNLAVNTAKVIANPLAALLKATVTVLLIIFMMPALGLARLSELLQKAVELTTWNPTEN